MGNNITSEAEFDFIEGNEDYENESDSELEYEIPFALVEQITQEEVSNAIGGILGQIAGYPSRSSVNNEMPVIRKKPDLSTFCHTKLYKEIKALCAFPASSKLPCENWSLMRGLLKRENGIVSHTHQMGGFSANQQRRIRTLFVPNNKETRLMSLEAKVFLSSFNKDGTKLITGSQDVVRIYDATKGTYHLVDRLRVPDVNWSILDIDFSPCGKFFAYSTWSEYFFVIPINGSVGNAKWYDLNAPQNRNAVYSIRFSPCGSTLIGGCSNSCVYMCDLETTNIRTVHTKAGIPVDINAISYITDKDPNVFVSGCDNGTVKLWDARLVGGGSSGSSSEDRRRQNRSQTRSQPAGVFLGHLDGITYIDSRNDGNYILTNSKDQSIKIWDLRMPTPSNKVNKNSNASSIEWDYRWDTVPQEYYNPKSPLDGDVSVMTYRGHRVTKSLLRAKFSPLEQTGQRYIYTGCSTGRIIIYDVLTGQIKEAIQSHKDIVRDLAWHPVRSEIVSSSWDSHVNLNTFKPNPLLNKRSNTESSGSSSSNCSGGSRRRSLRLEHRNNADIGSEIERDGPNEPW